MDNTRFSLDTLLGAFNRNPLATRAQTTQGNETHDVPTNGTMAFVQNIEPFTTRAQKERVASVHFADNTLDTTSAAFKRLVSLSPEQLAGIGDYILRNRQHFETQIVGHIEHYSELLMKMDVSADRIAKVHAIPLAAMGLLLENLDFDLALDNALTHYTAGIAKAKCFSAKTELDIAEHFFSMIDGLDSGAGVIHKDGLLYVQMANALKYIKEQYGDTTDKNRLFAELKRHERFKDSNKLERLQTGRGRYWVFTEPTD